MPYDADNETDDDDDDDDDDYDDDLYDDFYPNNIHRCCSRCIYSCPITHQGSEPPLAVVWASCDAETTDAMPRTLDWRF